MIDYNNIQQIFGDPLNDMAHSEKQGMPFILKAGLFLLALRTVGYFYKKYLDEQYEKNEGIESGMGGWFNYLIWKISDKLEVFNGIDFIANLPDYLTVL